MKPMRLSRSSGLRIFGTSAAAFLVLLVVLGRSANSAPPAAGPLRRLESNPRYFTDGSGKPILLTGSHNWHNFQDNGHGLPGSEDPPPEFDYDGYLDFLERHGHNFFRLWRWESPKWTDDPPDRTFKYSFPHPWKRSGPGDAADGKPKFDLKSFDPSYFDRLRDRVKKAGDRGIYVSVMLFEGRELQFTDAWTFHPFHAPNNINEIDADTARRGSRYNQLKDDPMGKKVLALQEAYVKKVIDTVNDLDNVLYEICNEAGDYSTSWQYHFIDFIHKDEAGRPKQHPVGMTFQYSGGSNKLLIDSHADWISPNAGSSEESYKEKPSATSVGKVVVNDTDHLWGHTGGDDLWVWRSFMRGLNVLFMEDLSPSPTWQDSARVAMGQVRALSRQIDLAHMIPAPQFATTGYALGLRIREYLVYHDGSQGEFSVDLRNIGGNWEVEWYDPTHGRFLAGEEISGGDRRVLTTPFPGPAAVHLKRIVE